MQSINQHLVWCLFVLGDSLVACPDIARFKENWSNHHVISIILFIFATELLDLKRVELM